MCSGSPGNATSFCVSVPRPFSSGFRLCPCSPPGVRLLAAFASVLSDTCAFPTSVRRELGFRDNRRRLQLASCRRALCGLHAGGRIRLLNSGCKVKCLGYGARDCIKRAVTINAVIAWRLVVMTLLGGESAELPVEVLCTRIQTRVLRQFAAGRGLARPGNLGWPCGAWRSSAATCTARTPPARPPEDQERLEALGYRGRSLRIEELVRTASNPLTGVALTLACGAGAAGG